MKFFLSILSIAILVVSSFNSVAQETVRKYLSGTGKDNTIEWEFFCTDGRNSEEWSTIPVPSQWELQGFGTYNYGKDRDNVRAKEQGLYKYSFNVPADWKGKVVDIIFEGSMTDTEIKINGKLAGEIHQGAFYRFKYNITKLLKYGKDNLLEVTVSKHSSNETVNDAERRSDFWIFGGIFRPVYLEILPKQHIERVAINATADGMFEMDVFMEGIKSATKVTAQIFNTDGTVAGKPFTAQISKNQSVVNLTSRLENPNLWTPESPNLYKVQVQIANGKPIHQFNQKFGFRTVELRERDGIYVNGTKIKFKGVCRHSFHPESGRTLSKAISISDVELMKEMNMNAVRMSHYPPDQHFLDVCDSLGLFVLDELAGWQTKYDTGVGTKLVNEMIIRDVNHPSIVIWDNGNEGGWNFELDKFFSILDPQKRPLIHPWQIFKGTDTQHYKDFNYGNGVVFGGKNVFFPTEVLHGLYDGGHGAGLEDYWNAMWNHPLSAGCFLWDFADEAVVRTDKGGILDTDGNHAADGIVGPYHEKEGSFYTVRELWAPVHFEDRYITDKFDGSFRIENRYHYTNLNQCSVNWEWVTLPAPGESNRKVISSGSDKMPNVLPANFDTLKINVPENFKQTDVLYITITDQHGKEINRWSWPVSTPAEVTDRILPDKEVADITVEDGDSTLTVRSNKTEFRFCKESGLLKSVIADNRPVSFANGPKLTETKSGFYSFKHYKSDLGYVIEAVQGRFMSVKWTVLSNGLLKLECKYYPQNAHNNLLGINFSYPEDKVTGMRWMGYGPYRVWKNRMKGNALDVWHKDYNDAVTGETFNYPEFKGFHKGLYWVTIENREKDFTIISGSEDIFLRMFTPKKPSHIDNNNVAPVFPEGDISFLHGISAIGTKFKEAKQMGPMSQPNHFLHYKYKFSKDIVLYFDFR
jgi:hypothetical protein